MRIDLKTEGLDAVRDVIRRLSGPQMREAQAEALNDVAKRMQREMRSEIAGAFDRPTPFIALSPKYVAATASNLSVRIIPTLDARNLPSTGGKVGVDPQHVLQAQEWGGRRADKKSEVALRRAGILPNGYQTAIPEQPYPGTDDGRGNLRGAFVSQLISYLQASPEVGFKQNMSARRMRQVHKGTAKVAGRRYFVAYGRMRGGRAGHLAPGIWAAAGTQGVDVRPVLMFVRAPTYQPRISMERVVESAGGEDYLASRMRFRIRQAAGV